MDVKKSLHMKTGDDEASYSHNLFASRLLELSTPITVKALAKTLTSCCCSSSSNWAPLIIDHHHDHQGPPAAAAGGRGGGLVLNLVDFGCGIGPNPVSVLKSFLKAVEESSCLEFDSNQLAGRRQLPCPELHVFFNDLPGNDFNSLFKDLISYLTTLNLQHPINNNDDDKKLPRPNFSCFISGIPGSFHGRLFPTATLHFAHAAYSAHYLSKVPPGLFDEEGRALNKGTVYISEESPVCVWEAYLSQFQEDMTAFLKSRSEEMVSGGAVVMLIMCRKSKDPRQEVLPHFNCVDKALIQLASKGMVSEEKIDSCNFPFYAVSLEELSDIVHKEGTFEIEETQDLPLEYTSSLIFDPDMEVQQKGKKLAAMLRSFTESMFVLYFGEGVMDELYDTVARFMTETVSNGNPVVNNCTVVLRKKKIINSL